MRTAKEIWSDWADALVDLGLQGSHRLEKYLNIQDCLEKSLKNKICLEKYLKTLKGLEKSLNFTICKRIQHCFFEGLNQYKIVVPLFGAAYAAPNKGTIISHWFSKTNIFSNGLHFRSRILTCKSVFFISFQSWKQ